MKQVLILEPLLNTYKSALFFKSKEPDISTLRAVKLLKKNFDVKYIDFKIDNANKKEIINEIKKSNYLFINIKSYNFKISLEIISYATKYKPSVRIFLFGQLPEAKPKFFLEKFKKVHIVIGEIYQFTHEFIHQTTRASCSFSKIFIGTYYKNLDSIPKIDLEEIKKRDYYTIYPLKKIRKYKWAFMNLSEGCSYNCIFCSQTLRISHGKKFRHFSVNEAIKRIKRVLDAGFNTIRFRDDDFLGDIQFIQNLCQEIKKNKLNFKWMAQIRADRIDEKIIELMKEAGCECVNFGIESGSPRILKIIKKKININQIKNTVALCKKYDVLIVAYFMIGLPTETLKEVRQSVNLSFKFKPDVLQICLFTPYEGSPFYEANKNIFKKDIGYKIFHYTDLIHNFSKVPKKKLHRIYLLWYIRFYLLKPYKTLRIITNLFIFHPKRIIIIGSEFLRSIFYLEI